MPYRPSIDKQLQQWQLNDSLMLKNRKLVQKLHQQQYKKSIIYQNQQRKQKSRPQSSPSHSIQINTSINQLRQMATQQKLQSQKITNRLKYLNTATQRQEKLVNSAKEKFYKITELRRKSFTEKSFFSKERKNFLLQHQKTVFLKASSIKSERIRTTESQHRAFEQKKSKAQKVKQQSQLNQSIIQQQKQYEKSIRSQKAIRIKQQEQLQHQKSVIRSRQKIKQGVINHKQDILKQYQQVQKQMKNNKSLMKSFEQKAYKIFDQKQKQEKELQQYRAYLGLNKSQVSSSRVQKREPIIDDTMLFKARQKKQNRNTNQLSTKRNNSQNNYPYSRPQHYKTNRNTQISFYVTNPQQH